MRRLGRFLDSARLADVEVLADGRSYHAHRVVLARHSLVLRGLFTKEGNHGMVHGPFRLSVSTPCPGPERHDEGEEGASQASGAVELPPGVWPLLAAYMYEESLVLHQHNVLPLFDSAVRLKARLP